MSTSLMRVIARYSRETSILAADLQRTRHDPYGELGTAKHSANNVTIDAKSAEECLLRTPSAACRIRLAPIPFGRECLACQESDSLFALSGLYLRGSIRPVVCGRLVLTGISGSTVLPGFILSIKKAAVAVAENVGQCFRIVQRNAAGRVRIY